MIICVDCGQLKKETNFVILGTSHGKPIRGDKCRKCFREERKRVGLCICGRPLHTQRLCVSCHNSYLRSKKKLYDNDKQAAFNKYGNQCVYCGESESVFLTIDHIDGGGNKHRQRSKKSVYLWLRQNNYPDDFQVCCYNCNSAKHLIGEEKLQKLLRKRKPYVTS